MLKAQISVKINKNVCVIAVANEIAGISRASRRKISYPKELP